MKIKNNDWDIFVKVMHYMNPEIHEQFTLLRREINQFQNIEKFLSRENLSEKNIVAYFSKILKKYGGKIEETPQYLLLAFAIKDKCPFDLLNNIILNGLDKQYLLNYILHSQNEYGIHLAMSELGNDLGKYGTFYRHCKKTIDDCVFNKFVYNRLTDFLIAHVQSGKSIPYEDCDYIFRYTSNNKIDEIVNSCKWDNDIYYYLVENKNLSDNVRIHAMSYIDDYMYLSEMPNPAKEDIGNSALEGYLFDGVEFTPAWRYLHKIVAEPNKFMTEKQQLDFVNKINEYGLYFQNMELLSKMTMGTSSPKVLSYLLNHRSPDIASLALINQHTPKEDVASIIDSLVFYCENKELLPLAHSLPAIVFNRSLFLRAFKNGGVVEKMKPDSLIYLTKNFDSIQEREFLSIPNIPIEVFDYMNKKLVGQRKFMTKINLMISNVAEFSIEEKQMFLKLFDSIIFHENYMSFFDVHNGQYVYDNSFICETVISKNPVTILKTIKCIIDYVERDIGDNPYKQSLKQELLSCLNVFKKYVIEIKKKKHITDYSELLSYRTLCHYTGDIWHKVGKFNTTYDVYKFALNGGIEFSNLKDIVIHWKLKT